MAPRLEGNDLDIRTLYEDIVDALEIVASFDHDETSVDLPDLDWADEILADHLDWFLESVKKKEVSDWDVLSTDVQATFLISNTDLFWENMIAAKIPTIDLWPTFKLFLETRKDEIK